MSDETIKPSTAIAGKIAGMDICRVPIYQTVIGNAGWETDMLKAISACKKLGVKTFEIDAKYDANAVVRTGDGKVSLSGMIRMSMFGEVVRVEGDEWKDEAKTGEAKKGADVLTVYAVVVE
jgi:hypothetical protein